MTDIERCLKQMIKSHESDVRRIIDYYNDEIIRTPNPDDEEEEEDDYYQIETYDNLYDHPVQNIYVLITGHSIANFITPELTRELNDLFIQMITTEHDANV